jgi:hypothetical protein
MNITQHSARAITTAHTDPVRAVRVRRCPRQTQPWPQSQCARTLSATSTRHVCSDDKQCSHASGVTRDLNRTSTACTRTSRSTRLLSNALPQHARINHSSIKHLTHSYARAISSGNDSARTSRGTMTPSISGGTDSCSCVYVRARAYVLTVNHTTNTPAQLTIQQHDRLRLQNYSVHIVSTTINTHTHTRIASLTATRPSSSVRSNISARNRDAQRAKGRRPLEAQRDKALCARTNTHHTHTRTHMHNTQLAVVHVAA